MISDETYNLLKTKFKNKIENLKIADVRLGIHLSAVKLSDDSYGIAATMHDSESHCIKKNRDFDDFTPTHIKGQKVSDLFEIQKKSNITDTLKIAVLNAISSTLILNGNYKTIENADPIELIDISPQKTITIVGAFQSYIQKISETDNKLYVLELNEKALKDEHRKYYVPANEFDSVIKISDIVIITGLTLVNHTIDSLLSSVLPHTKVIVTGPSSSIIPDVLFDKKVNIIGATRITNPDLLFTIVSESGSGYHLFKYCAQKICIINE